MAEVFGEDADGLAFGAFPDDGADLGFDQEVEKLKLKESDDAKTKEVKRERRSNLWRYEFTHRDVCWDFLHERPIPYTFKFDREFAHEKFEGILLMHKVVPLPIPTAYPPANGTLERSNKDLQRWLEGFALDWMWNYDELVECGSASSRFTRLEDRRRRCRCYQGHPRRLR